MKEALLKIAAICGATLLAASAGAATTRAATETYVQQSLAGYATTKALAAAVANAGKVKSVNGEVGDVVVTAAGIGAATANDLAVVKAMISATDATFSNSVLQVGIGTLGITTNDLQVVHDLAELPVGTSITTVGGLLAALAAGLAALKKTVSTLSAKVDSANAALEEVA